MRCLFLEMSGTDPGFLYTGFRWENGWPIAPPPPPTATEPAVPLQTPQLPAPPQLPQLVPSQRLEEPSTYPPTDMRITAYNTNNTQVMDLAPQVEGEDDQASEYSDRTGTSYVTSQLSDSEEEEEGYEDPKKVKLGNGYGQCRAAREATMAREIVDISCNENALSSEKKKGNRVGTMDRCLDPDVKNCFKGARIEKNGNIVNQYLSSSFDPSTLICITCTKEHDITDGGDGSVCYVLSDQNFVATVPGCEGKACLKIVRIENASLIELAGIFLEIFDGKPVKAGTCILLTSLSYLARVGAAAYAAEWRVAVNMLVGRWAGVLVCPVFPIHASELPGPLYGELLILHTWFRKMYSGTNQSLQSAWDRYAEILLEVSEGASSLDSPEFQTPLLPSSLDPRSNFAPIFFSTSSTSPTIIFSLDRKAVYELLLSLAVSLRRGFSISANPEAILARDTAATREGAKENKSLTIILAGGSNLSSLKPVFEGAGATVIDLTKPGWIITESNIASLKNELSALSDMEDAAVIFDLFGNSAYRFRHVDGSLVLPFRVGGSYHLLGDIQVVPDSNIGELVNLVKPLFALCVKHLLAIMPPLPRYLFFGCCLEKSHSTNVGAEGYSGKLLEATFHFRKVLKTNLVGSTDLGRFWVVDTLSCIGTTPPTMPEKLAALRLSFGSDGVHLTDSGRFHLFNNLAKTVLGLRDGSLGKPPNIAEAAASSLLSGQSFYWRGFVSDRGSATRPRAGRGRGGPSSSRGGTSRRDSQLQRPCPYSRPERGGRGRGRGAP